MREMTGVDKGEKVFVLAHEFAQVFGDAPRPALARRIDRQDGFHSRSLHGLFEDLRQIRQFARYCASDKTIRQRPSIREKPAYT